MSRNSSRGLRSLRQKTWRIDDPGSAPPTDSALQAAVSRPAAAFEQFVQHVQRQDAKTRHAGICAEWKR